MVWSYKYTKYTCAIDLVYCIKHKFGYYCTKLEVTVLTIDVSNFKLFAQEWSFKVSKLVIFSKFYKAG